MSRDEDFSAFVAGQWHRLLRSAVFLGCSPAEAEDVVQTTLVQCYLKWGRVSRAERPEAYVAKMLLNTFRESRRRKSSGDQVVAHVPDRPDPGTPDDERVVSVDAVRRALAGLGDRQREAVLLRYYLGLDEAECADVMGVPRGTVKSRLSRALTTLGDSADLLAFRTGGDV